MALSLIQNIIMVAVILVTLVFGLLPVLKYRPAKRQLNYCFGVYIILGIAFTFWVAYLHPSKQSYLVFEAIFFLSLGCIEYLNDRRTLN
ncbi:MULTISPECIES: hypothetical protein [Lacticaseibacillus]|uniref:hypothetical protein n=1 Tax=Lacticaseibacillus TaxID=2759736 RepID=UPI00063DBA86|nr:MULTISPECIES: hypothetical protein [Lacticaseibacillus]KLI75423.1 hypothetical protein AAW28_07900 [Lacticaseibacillus casei]